MEDSTNKIRLYGVVVGLQYYNYPDTLYKGLLVNIHSNNQVYVDDTLIGNLAKSDKFYDDASDIIDVLIKDNLLDDNGQDVIIITPEEIEEYIGKPTPGIISYADDKMAIVYLGDIDEDELFPEEYEDLSFVLTDKGYDYLNCLNDIEEAEREENMDRMFGAGFGKCEDYRFALSINGIAVRQAETGKFVVYDAAKNEFVDSTNMLLDIKDALYVMPTVELAVGDTVLHEGKPYYIVGTGREIKAVSYEDCTQTVLIPKSTIFGLKYFAKVFSIFGDNFASAGEIFNNPMMLMSLMNGNSNDLTKVLMFSSFANKDLATNPMLMALLMKDGDGDDFSKIAMLSMMTGNNPFAPKATKVEE